MSPAARMLARLTAGLAACLATQAWAGVTVSLTAPANGSEYGTGVNIALSATASANQGYTVSKVEFFQGTTLIGTDTSAPYSIVWSSVPTGNYSLTAKATAIKKNSPNQTATSAAVNITVGPLLHFIHADHLNTPRLVANQSGQTVWRWDQQEPFGVSVPDENPSGLGVFEFPLRFPGQYADKETNLAYNMARDYDAAVGRYIQSDPIGLGGGINTYVYVLDPLTQIDPEGLMGRAPGTFGRPDAPSSSTPAAPTVSISCDGEWKQKGHDEQLPKVLRLCTCYWLCIPCDRPAIWSSNKRDLPSTGGQLFYSGIGGSISSGGSCICKNKPGPEKSCKPCQSGGAQ